MSAKVSEIYSDLMGSPGVVLRRDNPLAGEMEVERGYLMWEQLCLCEDMGIGILSFLKTFRSSIDTS